MEPWREPNLAQIEPWREPGGALAGGARMERWRKPNGALEGAKGSPKWRLLRGRGLAASVWGIAVKWGQNQAQLESVCRIRKSRLAASPPGANIGGRPTPRLADMVYKNPKKCLGPNVTAAKCDGGEM